jgi:hypothetical protein
MRNSDAEQLTPISHIPYLIHRRLIKEILPKLPYILILIQIISPCPSKAQPRRIHPNTHQLRRRLDEPRHALAVDCANVLRNHRHDGGSLFFTLYRCRVVDERRRIRALVVELHVECLEGGYRFRDLVEECIDLLQRREIPVDRRE